MKSKEENLIKSIIHLEDHQIQEGAESIFNVSGGAFHLDCQPAPK